MAPLARDCFMITADEELEMVEHMPNIGREQAYVFFSTRQSCWIYVLKRPSGRVGVNYEVFKDVDQAYNVVQDRNKMAKK